MISGLNLIRKMGLTKDNLVLEIGSGANPFIRSDILLDKFPSITEKHRSSLKPVLLDDRPFIVGDACDLPFCHKAVDFVIARHVLEHLKNPTKFLYEIKRISTGAYIASPSPFIEILHGGYQDVDAKIDKKYRDFLHHGKGTLGHLWYILETHNKLFMLAKSDELYPIWLLLGYYIKKKTNYSKNKFFRFHPKWSETQLLKQSLENVEIVILGDVNDKEEEKVEIDELILFIENLSPQKNLKILLKSRIRKLLFATRKQIKIYDLICCPICKEKLLKNANLLICSNCGTYPIIKNIPILLPEALNK